MGRSMAVYRGHLSSWRRSRDFRPTDHACADETGLQSLVLIQVREQLGDRNPDRGPLYFEGTGTDFNKTRTTGHVSMAGRRIDNSNVRDAEGDVVVDACLESAQSVLRRQDLNAYERGCLDDLASGVFLPNDAQVGNSKPSFRDLDPLFRQWKNVPSISVLVENNHERRLQGRMIPFTQVSLLHLAVDKIAIWSEARAQIFVHRNEQSLRHATILLRIRIRTPLRIRLR